MDYKASYEAVWQYTLWAVIISIIVLLIVIVAYAEEGTASWYSVESCQREGTSGVYTASGERFSNNGLSSLSF